MQGGYPRSSARRMLRPVGYLRCPCWDHDRRLNNMRSPSVSLPPYDALPSCNALKCDARQCKLMTVETMEHPTDRRMSFRIYLRQALRAAALRPPNQRRGRRRAFVHPSHQGTAGAFRASCGQKCFGSHGAARPCHWQRTGPICETNALNILRYQASCKLVARHDQCFAGWYGASGPCAPGTQNPLCPEYA